ncbi:lysophospholipase [Mycena belliarum]|uniref:Lysophospholipase n=1 Tax=Mycena belliarum TaxID=1033014 RepID=A0AAD6U2K5_9AGAR|nr:lysophospholipase [Mycena belliae]
MASFEEEWLTGVGGTSFYTRLYRPTSSIRGALVFVHGYNEHHSRYEGFHASWAARGFAVFAYDLRGFGRTALDPSKPSNSAYGQMGAALADVEWAIKHARSLFPDTVPLFLMGHSMGGGIVLDFIVSKTTARDKATISLLSGVISSSPWILLSNPLPTFIFWIFALFRIMIPNVRFSTPIRPKALSHDLSVGESLIRDPWVREYGTYGSLYDMLKMGTYLDKEGHKYWPKTLPLLLLHGTADDHNSCPSSENFYKALDADDKRLILYPDAFHDLMSEPDIKDQYQEDCMAWVESHLPRLTSPSGLVDSRRAPWQSADGE